MSMQQYCLRWNNHQPNFISVFSSLLNNESLVDVTLSAEGRHLQAHKLVLSACSSYFQSLFTINPCQHPIVILKDVNFVDLKVMIDFMYYGEVNISQEQLPHILKTAELLKIKGLAEIPVDASVQAKTTTIANNTTSQQQQSTSVDRGGQTTAAELLSSTGDNGSATVSSWNTGQDSGGLINLQRQSISPGIVAGGVSCPLSPSSRRKRLRKSSTSTDSSNRPTQSLSQQSSLTQQLDLTTSDPSNSNITTSHPSPLHLHLQHHTLPILHPLHHHTSSHSHHSHHSSQQHQITNIVNSDGAMSPMAATTTSGVSGGGTSGGPSATTSATVTSIKSDPGETSGSGSYGDGNNGVKYEQLQVQQQQQQQQQPIELLHRVSSHDSGNGGGDSSGSGHSPHQITLQIPSQEINQPSHTIETSSMDLPGSSSTSSQPDRLQIVHPSTTTSNPLNQSPPVILHVTPTTLSRLASNSPPLGGSTSIATMGTKRCRFLKRQSRVKRELDTSSSDPIHPHLYHQYSSEHYERYGDSLTVPHRVERQVSDPLPVSGPVSPPPQGSKMLTVPGSAILVKQHSHPLLPSQQSQPYQISSPPIQHTPSSYSHTTQTTQTSTSTETDSTTASTGPPIIYIDSLTSPHISTASVQQESGSAHATATLRVRTDELKRSASSPAQTSTARSSHCPVVRSGPALGCNYCWNTVDTHGRILRRKTKYHCPECQTNLCIVPCFQEYHERHSSGTSGAASDALTLTQSVMRVFPKTSSM